MYLLYVPLVCTSPLTSPSLFLTTPHLISVQPGRPVCTYVEGQGALEYQGTWPWDAGHTCDVTAGHTQHAGTGEGRQVSGNPPQWWYLGATSGECVRATTAR
jgi:hypothetical protein